MKKLFAILLTITMLLTFLAGCMPAPAAPAQTAPTTAPTVTETKPTEAPAKTDDTKEPTMFTFAVVSEPPSIDPGRSVGTPQSSIYTALYEGLVNVDVKTGKIIPGVAESWTVSEDGKEYIFKLREGLKWSDGKPLTAHDFVYSWIRVLDPATASSYSWFVEMFLENASEFMAGEVPAEEVGVKALDDRTLKVNLKIPASYFTQALLTGCWFPVREDVVSKYPDRWTFSANTYISNGPYKFVEYQIGSHILIEKNEHYHAADQVGVDRIKFVFIPDSNTAYAAFQAGEIDGTWDIPATEILEIMTTDDRLHLGHSLSFSFIRLNTKRAGLDNEKVRRAINIAFDRKAYLEGLGSLMATPAFGTAPKGLIMDGKDFRDYSGDNGLTATAQVEEARKLLAEAGYPNGQGLPTYGIHCTQTQIKSAEILQEMLLNNLGIKTEIKPVDSKVFFPMMVEGNYDIGFGGWGGDYDHPMTFLELFMSHAVDNCTGWANPKFDELLDKARMELDEAKALEYMVEAERLLIKESPIVPVSFPTNAIIMNKNVKNWYYSPKKTLFLQRVTVE